jgi:hypothetical protein
MLMGNCGRVCVVAFDCVFRFHRRGTRAFVSLRLSWIQVAHLKVLFRIWRGNVVAMFTHAGLFQLLLQAMLTINVIKLPITIGVITGIRRARQTRGFSLISSIGGFHSQITQSDQTEMAPLIFCNGQLQDPMMNNRGKFLINNIIKIWIERIV